MSTGTLGCKDFIRNNRSWITVTPEHVIGDMNDWIAENHVQVINVETIWTNNLREGEHPPLTEGFGGARLWYMTIPATEI